MIKGALILAVGLGIGYAKGISENTALLDKVSEMATSLDNWSKAERERSEMEREKIARENAAAENVEDAVEEEAEEEPASHT